MRRSKQHRGTLVHKALAAVIVVALGATIVAAAYDYDQESQQDRQQPYQGRQQRSMQSQGQDSWQQGRQSGMQGRNQQIERQVANELRQEGFGQEGQIMVLATGNRVILLGTVSDQDQKQQAEEVTNQVSGVQQVDNRLQVSRGTGRQDDSQLQQTIQQQLRNRTSAGQNIQVQARNGRVTLSGQVNDWQEMADVLEAAFAAGAQNVTSQLSTTGQSQYSAAQDQWRSQQQGDQYGYDQQGATPPSRRYGRSSDYDQFESRGQMDRGYYPPYGYTPGQDDQTQWQDRQQQQRQGRMQQGQQQWDQQQWDQPQRGMRMQQQRGPQQFSASDLSLAHRIAMQLQQQLTTDKTIQVMDPQAIYVHVSQGTVKLHGSVQDNNEKRLAEQIARSVRGVQNVQNQLQVAGEGGEFQTFGYVPGQMDQGEQQDQSRRQGQIRTDDQSQWDSSSQQGQTGGIGSQPSQSGTGAGQSSSTYRSRSQQQTSGQQSRLGQQAMSALDKQLTQQIQQQLKQRFPQANINVSASQGTITLSGSVQDQNQKQQAEKIVENIGGVKNVQNQLTVGGQQQQYGQQTGQQQTDQQQAGQQQMSASDKQLAQQVEQRLQQQLPQANISVSARQGTVTLQGSVEEQNQKQQAEQIAQSIRGVQDIQNQISVGDFPALGYTPGQDRQRQQMGQQQRGASDMVLSHQIAMQLQQQLGSGQIVHVMDPQAIYVHVSQGTVMLHGSVQDQSQIREAEQVIQNISGVQNVENQLTVGGRQPWQQTGQQQPREQQFGQQTGQQQESRMSASDQKLAQQIEQRLQSQLSDANINVTVSQGTATLQGSVQDNNQKQQAERIARSISGVQNIRNNLSVGGQAGDFPALGYIPGQEGQAQQDTGTGISGDAQCIQMFKQGLTDQNLQSIAQHVYVTCHNGTMALYGYVKSDAEKDQLEKATEQVSGIKEVDNNLIVRKEGAEQKSDSELQEDVESQLWWSPYVDSDKIQVSVQNGTVTLSGQADDWDAMRAAVKNAFDAGAKRVKSQIQYNQSGRQTGITDPGATRRSESQRSGTDRSTAEHPSGIDNDSSDR